MFALNFIIAFAFEITTCGGNIKGPEIIIIRSVTGHLVSVEFERKSKEVRAAER